MNSQVYVFDPATKDGLSRVRGVGRYLQTLHENFQHEFTFVDRISMVDRTSTFINPFFNFLAHPLIMRRVAKKQIAVIHDTIPLKYPQHFPIGLRGRIFLFLNKRALRLYDRVITVSESVKADVIRYFDINPDIVHVVYQTIKQSYFETPGTTLTTQLPYGLAPQSYYIYVGDATWNKNLVNIAKAIQLADLRCLFVGNVFSKKLPSADRMNPWLRELTEFQEITKNDNRFIFPGFIEDGDLQTFYRNAIGNILVSRDEGFGLSYLEAATCGIPTVAASTPVQKEIASGAASFADPDSVEQIRDAILLLKNNKEIRNTIATAAKKRSNDFLPAIFKKNLLDVIGR